MNHRKHSNSMWIIRHQTGRQRHPSFTAIPSSVERCDYCGLTGETLHRLVSGKNPLVHSVVLQENGKSIRLVSLESLFSFIEHEISSRLYLNEGGTDRE